MAIPLAKLSLLIGAGLVGSALANREGGMSDFVSGAFKMVYRQIQRKDDTSPTIKKSENSSLLAQVNSLREELHRLGNGNNSVVIIEERSGRRTIGAVVVVIVVGYGYIWWKGWKLSDMMFATRRSLSDARASVAKQLEQVHSSVTTAKRQLSSRIERVDSNIEECKELTSETRTEVFKLQGEARKFTTNVETVHLAVKNLESKIGEIEGKQDLTNLGVDRLCEFAKSIENGRTASIQASPSTSSRPAIEPPPVIHRVLSKTMSLQQERKSLEPPSQSLQVLTKTNSLQPDLVFMEPPSPSVQVLTKTSTFQPELVFMESPSPSIKVSPSSSEALKRPPITPISRTSSMPTESPAPSSKNDSSSSSRFGWFFGGGAR